MDQVDKPAGRDRDFERFIEAQRKHTEAAAKKRSWGTGSAGTIAMILLVLLLKAPRIAKQFFRERNPQPAPVQPAEAEQLAGDEAWRNIEQELARQQAERDEPGDGEGMKR